LSLLQLRRHGNCIHMWQPDTKQESYVVSSTKNLNLVIQTFCTTRTKKTRDKRITLYPGEMGRKQKRKGENAAQKKQKTDHLDTFSWSAFDSIIEKEKLQNEEESEDLSEREEEEEGEDENEEDFISRKNIKDQRKKLNEELIAEREKELVFQHVLPESDADFERLIAGSPNSSYIWIQYMAFKLTNADIESARKIAERALKKIHYREEQEKFNIFAAMMNLESKFGDEESQKKIFNRAVQYCEAKDVYLQQAKIYEQNGDDKKVHEIFQKMMKKFFKSKKPYEAYEQYLIQNKQYKKANEVLERSLKNLSRHKHLKVISKFAILHYKYGSIIDGHQIFEQLISNYPKRTDIWSMYIEAEKNAKRMEQVRNLYERVVNLNLSTKKMQSFLKRYLKFEKEQDSEEGQEHVKQLARDYIAMKTSN
jgi:rRNA biogenesis protein RRP5